MAELVKINTDYLNVQKASAILRAINHPLRQQMLQLLAKKHTLSVTEIYVHFRLVQSVASQHLAILRQAGVVSTSRNGKVIQYSINSIKIRKVSDAVQQLLSKRH
jgi:DNA-binding transcriptional ArsR family regulator